MPPTEKNTLKELPSVKELEAKLYEGNFPSEGLTKIVSEGLIPGLLDTPQSDGAYEKAILEYLSQTGHQQRINFNRYLKSNKSKIIKEINTAFPDKTNLNIGKQLKILSTKLEYAITHYEQFEKIDQNDPFFFDLLFSCKNKDEFIAKVVDKLDLKNTENIKKLAKYISKNIAQLKTIIPEKKLSNLESFQQMLAHPDAMVGLQNFKNTLTRSPRFVGNTMVYNGMASPERVIQLITCLLDEKLGVDAFFEFLDELNVKNFEEFHQFLSDKTNIESLKKGLPYNTRQPQKLIALTNIYPSFESIESPNKEAIKDIFKKVLSEENDPDFDASALEALYQLSPDEQQQIAQKLQENYITLSSSLDVNAKAKLNTFRNICQSFSFVNYDFLQDRQQAIQGDIVESMLVQKNFTDTRFLQYLNGLDKNQRTKLGQDIQQKLTDASLPPENRTKLETYQKLLNHSGLVVSLVTEIATQTNVIEQHKAYLKSKTELNAIESKLQSTQPNKAELESKQKELSLKIKTYEARRDGLSDAFRENAKHIMAKQQEIKDLESLQSLEGELNASIQKLESDRLDSEQRLGILENSRAGLERLEKQLTAQLKLKDSYEKDVSQLDQIERQLVATTSPLLELEASLASKRYALVVKQGRYQKKNVALNTKYEIPDAVPNLAEVTSEKKRSIKTKKEKLEQLEEQIKKSERVFQRTSQQLATKTSIAQNLPKQHGKALELLAGIIETDGTTTEITDITALAQIKTILLDMVEKRYNPKAQGEKKKRSNQFVEQYNKLPPDKKINPKENLKSTAFSIKSKEKKLPYVLKVGIPEHHEHYGQYQVLIELYKQYESNSVGLKEAIADKVAALQEDQENAAQTTASTTAEIERLTIEKNELKIEVTKLKGNLKALQKELGGLEQEVSALEEVTELRTEIEKLKIGISADAAEIKSIGQQTETLEQSKAKITARINAYPLGVIDDEIIQQYDEAIIAKQAVIADLEKKVALQEKISSDEAQIKALRSQYKVSEMEEVEAKIKSAETELAKLQDEQTLLQQPLTAAIEGLSKGPVICDSLVIPDGCMLKSINFPSAAPASAAGSLTGCQQSVVGQAFSELTLSSKAGHELHVQHEGGGHLYFSVQEPQKKPNSQEGLRDLAFMLYSQWLKTKNNIVIDAASAEDASMIKEIFKSISEEDPKFNIESNLEFRGHQPQLLQSTPTSSPFKDSFMAYKEKVNITKERDVNESAALFLVKNCANPKLGAEIKRILNQGLKNAVLAKLREVDENPYLNVARANYYKQLGADEVKNNVRATDMLEFLKNGKAPTPPGPPELDKLRDALAHQTIWSRLRGN